MEANGNSNMVTIVTFSKKGARILKGEDASKWASRDDALVNPKFPLRVPPHLWEKHGDRITVISQAEWDKRNPAAEAQKTHPQPKKINWLNLAFITSLALNAALLFFVCRG